MSAVEEMRMGELAERAGLSVRTIRYYISRGLLDGPVRHGRAAAYTQEHLEKLRKIKELKDDGKTLREIGHVLDSPGGGDNLGRPTKWQRYRVAEDVVVYVSGEAGPWRKKHIRSSLSDMAERLEK